MQEAPNFEDGLKRCAAEHRRKIAMAEMERLAEAIFIGAAAHGVPFDHEARDAFVSARMFIHARDDWRNENDPDFQIKGDT